MIDQIRRLTDGQIIELGGETLAALVVHVPIPAFGDGQDCPALARSQWRRSAAVVVAERFRARPFVRFGEANHLAVQGMMRLRRSASAPFLPAASL